MNQVNLVGRLTKTPDMRTTANGTAVCTFTLAVDRRYTDNSGDRQTDFIPIVCWRKLAENVGQYVTKGRRVGVCGSMQVRSYDAKDGSRRYKTEVIADEVEFLDSKSAGETEPAGDGYGEPIEYDNELPF